MAANAMFRVARAGLLVGLASSLATVPAGALTTPKESSSFLEQKAFFRPELYISSSQAPLAEIVDRLPNREALQAFAARPAADGSPMHVFIDPRSGAAVNLMGPVPLIPGRGVGNHVTVQSLAAALGRNVEQVDEAVVAEAARAFVLQYRDVLGIDGSQLGAVTAARVTPDLWQISIPQTYRGVPVRFGRVAASVSHGNLVTVGTETWGNVSLRSVTPAFGAEKAVEAGFAYLEGRTGHDVITKEPALEIVPYAPPDQQEGEGFAGSVGRGYGHYLVWTFSFQRAPELANWEVMVDARTGEVLAVQDTNQYVERGFTGGVYPVTNTGICPDAGRCGTMQLGWPMPFANTGFASPNNFTNSAGIYNYSSGTATTTLSGRYVRMVDTCGAVSESSATGAINLGGANNQHDCTSGGSSAGDTPASRSGFYELNKLAEQARGWLPGNAWLNAQLTSNMNLNQTCNAFWGGGTVNFYRSGGGCRNTGEIAAVFDHEWGHGLDDNDAVGALSNSSEGYADIAAIYRLQTSCVGYGFFQTDDGCGQTADGTGFNTNENQNGGLHCNTNCSGVRDADWAKHTDNTPDTPANFVCGSCLSGSGPCGRQVHCAAAPSRQAAWDFATRDLTAAPFGLDSQSAFIVANRVFYQGSGNIGAWHSCTCPSTSAGCATANGYIQWITADDDNGNLNDGTPHMTAIFNAFNRHGIACATPTAQNSGCSAGPSLAPNLTATPGNFSVALSWGSISGATRYWVFRSEGHAGCDFGKALVAEVTGLTYTDTQVANGRTYYYNVVAAGSSSSCYGRASNCVNATPVATVTPDYSVSCSPASLTVQQGNSAGTTCTVTSTGGFASAVALSCANLTAGASCSFSPASVTPPANGSVSSTLTVNAGTAAAGASTFQAVGTSGALTRTANVGLTVTAAPVPNFALSASPGSVSVAQGGTGGSTVTITSSNGFASAVTLSTSALPSGVTASFVPNPATPPANGTTSSALTFTAGATAATGTSTVTITGVSGSVTRTTTVSLTVTGTGGQDLVATFDTARQAPSCGTTVGRSCDTGTSLVLGRANLGPEPNQPNTVADSCADGASGTFHADESNDRIRVFTTDGSNFAPGKTVTIQATVWAWTTPSSDTADFFYAPNAASPTWTLIGSVQPTAAGAQTLSVNYTLPSGAAQQAVRVQFRYQSTNAACSAGNYNDRDDLVFAVAVPPVTTVYSDDFETATGWTTNPNGTDTATTGAWERGDPEDTTDGGAKQLGTTTSGSNDLVTARLAGASSGANDLDGGTTSVQSPLITLPSSGSLTLSFQYYLAHGSNSSTADFFRAYVVSGSTSTQVFQSLGAASNRNGAWTAATASLNAFAGQTVRIRFEAADASTASLVEAGVDDVTITQQ